MNLNVRAVVTLPVVLMLHGYTYNAHADNSPLAFTDIAAVNNMNLPGELNESMAFGDYDNDGDEDLFLSVDGQNRLFRNNGLGAFVDVTANAGLANTTHFSVGASFGDLDNDGDLDLYVVSFNEGVPDELYRNDGPIGVGGETVFTDITLAANITDEKSSRGVAFLDYDRDGLLDIYVNAIIPSDDVVGHDIFYHNLGNLQFESIALDIGLDQAAGMGVGVTNTDVNNDNWPDIFTGNRSNDTNALYLNNADGTFTDIALAAGITSVGLGMGVISFDYDNDLDWDLYWTAFPGANNVPNALYQNQFSQTGVVSFIDMAAVSGTEDAGGWSIGANAADIDNDGWEDFVVGDGADDSSTPSVLYRNNADGTFTEVTEVIDGAVFDGRGTAFADWDGDGDMDLVIAGDNTVDDDTRMWRNDSPNTNRWLQIKLEGTQSNRSAIGAKVTVTTELGARMQMVSGGAGRGSQNSLPLEFGLGQARQILRADVLWPSGIIQNIRNSVALDTKVTIKELELTSELGTCPGRNTFRVRGATPNSNLEMYVGVDGGTSTLRGASVCAGTSVDMGTARLFARIRTNAQGAGFVSKAVSPAFCNITRRFQVVNESTCSTSNVTGLTN